MSLTLNFCNFMTVRVISHVPLSLKILKTLIKISFQYRKFFDTEKAVPPIKSIFVRKRRYQQQIQFYYITARTAISTALPLTSSNFGTKIQKLKLDFLTKLTFQRIFKFALCTFMKNFFDDRGLKIIVVVFVENSISLFVFA